MTRALGTAIIEAALVNGLAQLPPGKYHPFELDTFGLGDVLMQQGQVEEALACYRRALACEPRSVDAQCGLANVAMRQGRFDEAAAGYRRVLTLRPGFAEVHNNLGAVLANQGKPHEAVAEYRRAIALKPSLLDCYRNLGRLILAQGVVPQALEVALDTLALAETVETRAFFVQCATHLPPDVTARMMSTAG